MANSDIIDLILTTAANVFEYSLPILGVMTGLVFVTSWLFRITIGASKHVFRD